MADVKVTTTNPQGQSASLRMDEKDERLELFKAMKRRGDLDDVKVEPFDDKPEADKPAAKR